MDQAPIDIKYNEALRWLEERFIIPKDWAKRCEVIKVKVVELMDEIAKKDTSEFKKINERFQPKRESINYEDIMGLNAMLLKTEEAKAKTLFGNFSSPIMKNITLIISLYEKNLVLLCECCKLINQYIGYEIPDLTKTVQGLEKFISDTNGKINERTLTRDKNSEKIKGLFKLYEIKQVETTPEISDQIVRKLGTLPQMLERISNMINSEKIRKVITSYESFYRALYGEDINSYDKNFLATLKRISKEGDYLLNPLASNKNNIYKVIDDKLSDYVLKFSKMKASDVIETSAWNFKTVEQSETETSSVTALLDRRTFNKLMNDLNEVYNFVCQRMDLIATKEETTICTYQLDILKVNNEVNQEYLSTMKKYLNELFTLLNDTLLTFLLKMFEDDKNLINIVNTFESIKQENINLEEGNLAFKKRIEESKTEIAELNKRVQTFKKDAKAMKKLMEKKLTDHLKRKITIIGDINLVA